jgi:uncharacterized protein with FMN-binding domain
VSAGGKGRISNELVAASCAAVLAVYAAGYWRTRDESRRIDDRAQERRAAQPVPSPATSPPEIVQAQTQSPVQATASAAPRMTATEEATPVAMPPKETQKSIPATSAPGVSLPASAVPATAATPEVDTSAATAALAAQSVPAPMPDAPPAPSANWRDGTYTGWGTSRHGDIKAQVVIRDGRIVEAGIASCETRYPCDVIGDIIAQPVARQSPEVDRVSRATESADAYYYGLVEALKEALIAPVQIAAPQ